MGLELAEQARGWRLPDVILYPTGGGTGLIGMWKAFAELRELGWLRSEKRPRLIACQSDGCAPIVRAFAAGARFAEPFPNAHTIASGLRVPAAVGDFMMLDAVRESGGCAIAGREGRIVERMKQAASLEGILVCPETAVCLDFLLGNAAGRTGESGRMRKWWCSIPGATLKVPGGGAAMNSPPDRRDGGIGRDPGSKGGSRSPLPPSADGDAHAPLWADVAGAPGETRAP